jgi:hypothetical protein
MIYFLLIVVGIFLGVVLKNRIPKLIESYIIKKKYEYKVRFHVYFLIHKKDSKTNDLIRTETVEIVIRSEDEIDAVDEVVDMVTEDVRVEIESIEKLW